MSHNANLYLSPESDRSIQKTLSLWALNSSVNSKKVEIGQMDIMLIPYLNACEILKTEEESFINPLICI